MADMLAAALDFIRRGIPVFPVSAKTKKPTTRNGFKDATTDEAQVRSWWTNGPGNMIGIPMGPRSGMWLVDADIDPAKGLDGPKELAQLTAQYGPLPETLASSTPRGGSHFYFRWNRVNIRNSASKVGPGLDVRGDGGYSIVPPSARTDGTLYRWRGNVTEPAEAPQWLVDKALRASKPKRARLTTATATPSSSPRDQAWALAALADECTAVTTAPPGTRNDRLNTAAFNLGQIIAAGGLSEQEVRDRLFAAAEACGLVADDGAQQAWATIASGLAAGKGQPRSRPTQTSPQPTPQPAPHPTPQPQPSPQPQPQPQPRSPGPQSSPQPQPQPRALPVIRLTEGQLPRIVNEAETALIAADCHIYQRGELVVHPTRLRLQAPNSRDAFGWQLTPVTTPYLIDTLTRIARFEKWNERAHDYLPKDCPERIAEVYLSRAGHWKLPILLGVVNTPFLRVDGSLCERPGYDRASALLFHPEGHTFPSIPNAPTLDDARAALKYLEDTLLAEFPFVGNIDRAVALSAILTGFDRRAMLTAPLHAFTSPMTGTGKSLLVDITSILTSGRAAEVISQGKTDEELEKRLGAALIASDQIISIDNCDRELGGGFLCKALTQPRVQVRLLGYTRNVKVPINSAFYATGNNLEISNDIVRRVLLCQIDAGIERPELREFKNDVFEIAYDKRGALVAAILTILRAWHSASTAIGVKPLGSYKQWSFRVRSPLIWLDREDPCASEKTARESDPGREVTYTIFMQWKQKLGTTNTFTIQQIIARAYVDQEFFGALDMVASAPGGGLSNQKLGHWLSKNKNKIVNGLKLQKTGFAQGGYPLWRLMTV